MGAVTVILLLWTAYIGLVWLLFYPSVHQTHGQVTRKEAAKYLTPILPLPSRTHDVQYACCYMSVSPGFEEFLRFEAPVADCLALA